MIRKVIQVGIFQDHALGGCLVFEKGLIQNGYQVERFPYRDIYKKDGLNSLNEQLIARAIEADLLFIGKGEHIFTETLERIQTKGTPILLWYGDMRNTPEPWLIANLKYVDAFFISSGGYKLQEYHSLGGPGLSAFYFNPSDPDLIPRIPNTKLYNAGFSASSYGFGEKERYEVLRYLIKRRDVEVRGGAERALVDQASIFQKKMQKITDRLGWTKRSPRVRGNEYIEFIKSCKIGIGVNAYQNIPKYTSDRLIHYVQFGTFYLPFYFPGQELFFPQDEMDSFQSVKELKDKMNHYLKHESLREKMAMKAQKRALTEYNAKNIVAMMIETLEKGQSERFPWCEVVNS